MAKPTKADYAARIISLAKEHDYGGRFHIPLRGRRLLECSRDKNRKTLFYIIGEDYRFRRASEQAAKEAMQDETSKHLLATAVKRLVEFRDADLYKAPR